MIMLRFIKDLSIKNKLVLIIQTTTFIALALGFSFVIYNTVQTYKNDTINQMLVTVKLMAEYCTTPLEFQYSAAADEALQKLSTIPEIKMCLVLDNQKKVFASYYKSKRKYEKFDIPITDSSNFIKQDILYLSQPILSNGTKIGTIFCKVSAEGLKKKIHNYITTMCLFLLIIMLVSYLIAIKIQKSISQPILILSDLTRKLSGKEDYSTLLEHDRKDEIGILYDGFNGMMNRIKLRILERDTANSALLEKTDQLSQALEDLQNTHRQLVQSQKMEALGHLTAGVAHEVNTPLGAIRSSVGNILNNLTQTLENIPLFFDSLSNDDIIIFQKLLNRSLQKKLITSAKDERKFKRAIANLLEENLIPDYDNMADTLVDMGIYDGVEEFLDTLKSEKGQCIVQNVYKLSGIQRSALTINTATDKASKVVFALKNYARYDHAGELVRSDISEGVDTVLTLYYNQIKHGIELNKFFEPDLPQILCHPDELNQVWTNLIHNAIQAMDNKGVLDVKVCQEDDFISTYIADTGKGIPPELREKIFEPFFTTKPKGEGTGLGLDIVKKIIEKHNGSISFESEPGKTTFLIKLPIL